MKVGLDWHSDFRDDEYSLQMTELSGGPFESKLFHFHGEFWENTSKMVKSKPLRANLKPQSKNPGSTPGT